MLNDALIWKSLKRAGRLTLIAGPCVIENERLCFQVASSLRAACRKLNINYIFKASFDKANRSSSATFRGPGLEAGLAILAKIRRDLGVAVLTDVHGVEQVRATAAVVDILQIPAFLCRQTDLIAAAVATGKVVNVKKGQFLSPAEMGQVARKAAAAGGKKLLLTERGTTFGYNNLVVDMRSIPILRGFGFPVIFDATHSVQLPGAGGDRSGGQREFAPVLARCAVAAGADGVFVETHPDPDRALSDGPNMIPLGQMTKLLAGLVKIPGGDLMTIDNLMRGRRLVLALAICFAAWPARTWAQRRAPQAAKPGGPVQFYHYNEDAPGGRVLDAIFSGSNSIYLPDGAVQVKGFKMIGVRDGQAGNVTVTALAPECRTDDKRKIASDPGPIQIFTPTTNLFVKGLGFFVAESNRVLLLSNQVETRVAKSMLQSSPLFAPPANTPPDAGQMVKILADRGRFDFRSNLVDYAEQVRVVDPQYQLDAPLLSIQFASNQTVETMFARPGVTLTLPGKGAATGASAHYFATNENALLELAGDADAAAHWQNGEQEAWAGKFNYDPKRHLLTGSGRARVRWPNQPAGAAAPHTFLELLANDAALQMAADGAAVEGLTAGGNVIIANQADQSSASAGKAIYDRPRDLLTLTEDPVWWNDQMEVRGETLSMSSSNRIYHAQGNARLKLRVSGMAGAPAGSTDQWLLVSAADLISQPVNSQTNLVTFRGDVRARLLDGEQLQAGLTAKVLLVWLSSGSQGLSNQVVLVVAREDVRAQTAADAAGVAKTISCGVLTAHRSMATGLWQSVVAEEDAVLESFGSGSAAVSNRLAAATVTAHFSSVTNQLENAVARGGVVFAQTAPGKRLDATGEGAVYTIGPEEQVELTGHPWAQTDRLIILNADRLKYDLKSGAVDASGQYHLVQHKRLAANGASPGPPRP